MNDEFFTKALEEDRYLKAIQLINRFETELQQQLEHIGDQFVRQNRELFVDQVEPSWNHRRSSSTILAFARVDYVMNRHESANDDARNLKLNISFRWIEPGELGHQSVDGALSLLSYKIKRASDETYAQVKEQTRQGDWPVHFADDAFSNSPGIIYIPVESAEQMRNASETLQEHFTKYGPLYGVDPDDGQS
jgi:hypothetical protein